MLLHQPLAVRSLASSDGSLPVRLELYPPDQATEDDESRCLVKGAWSCRFRIIHGATVVADERANGSDAIESLVNAIAQMRGRFRMTQLHAYYDEEGLEGTGLPAYRLPSGFGRAFDRRLEELVERELEERVKELEAKCSGSEDDSDG
jgi:hypothetical protein